VLGQHRAGCGVDQLENLGAGSARGEREGVVNVGRHAADDVGDVGWGVARNMDYLDLELADREALAIGE